MIARRVWAGVGLALLISVQAAASPDRGPVTNLPMPRFVSLKATEGNVRRGPSLTHRIDWIYKKKDVPLEIIGEYGHWRRIRDKDGVGGWVHYSLLSGVRTVIVQQDDIPLHVRPDPKTPVRAKLTSGVIARLGDCLPEWCHIKVSSYRGWVRKTALWGVRPDELRD